MHKIDQELKHMLAGEFDAAWAISEELQEMGPEGILDPQGKKNPEMWVRHSFNRGWFLLQQGDYQGGSQLLENGRFINVYGGGFLRTDAPLFNPAQHNIKGKSIILSLEGGFGDEMIHARFATSLKRMGASHVYIAASPELVSVFGRIEGVDKVILRNQASTVAHDFWLPGFSAGWVCGHTFEDLPNDPYLSPKLESVQVWQNIIKTDKKYKIGIRWAGNPKFEHQQFRRFPPEFLHNLARHEDVQLFSLQRDHNVMDLPNDIIDLQHFLISWEDTLAALSNLDLVITSCTSIAHAAAAMGKETWVIVPILPYHTWTYGAPESNTSPYYKSVKLYRQRRADKWNETFSALYEDLEKRFDLPHVDLPMCDREVKRLNLGCGFLKLDGFLNVDFSDICKPDQKVDLNQFPWPWADNEFSHIVAKDILEHLGNTGQDFINVIKEMYRISDNGAIWEVAVPHWRCDLAIDDPTHVRLITSTTFKLFDQKRCIEMAQRGHSESYLSIENDIDIEVCDTQFDFVGMWQDKLARKEITPEELDIALNTMNNVAESMRVLIQVHKPGRATKEEIANLGNKEKMMIKGVVPTV